MRALLTASLHARFDVAGCPRVRVHGPLELRGPLGADGLYYLRNVTAGVFAGDCYHTVVHCDADARAKVESSSATKVYGMPNDGFAEARVELTAEAGSTLVWGPHAIILHTGSALRQTTRICLHSGARVLLAESLVMGRIASGQRFDFRTFDSVLEVVGVDAAPLCREAFELSPCRDLETAMGDLCVLTTVYALGTIPEADRQAFDAVCAGQPLAGWSELPNSAGLLLKALSPSLNRATHLARECLALLG